MKSHFWQHDQWKSRGCRARNTQRVAKFYGPFYFEKEIDEKEFREWIRQIYKINCTRHISVKISNSQEMNERAKKSYIKIRDKKMKDESRKNQAYKHWREARQSIMLQKILGKNT